MTVININGNITNEQIDGAPSSVVFNHIGENVYAAKKIDSAIGVYISPIIVSEESIVRWDQLVADYDADGNSEVAIYFRSNSDQEQVITTTWNGPFLNKSYDISNLSGEYCQVMVVLFNKNVSSEYPVVRSLQLKYLSSAESVNVFTKVFDLGFVPKNIIPTYNGSVDKDSILRFAVSGYDSISDADYQNVDFDVVSVLDELPSTSTSIKVRVELIGNSKNTAVLDEFGFTVSGNGAKQLNKV